MGKYFKRHNIFGGNTDRGVIPPRQFLPNISLRIERSFIILLPPCLSHQDASNRPMVTESGRLYHFNLGLGQSWNLPLYLPYGVAPPKRAVIPEGYKFSENLLYIKTR